MRTSALLAVMLAAAPASATGTNGGTAFDSLSMDVAPRAAAMGGAYVATGDDADAMLYNPASLSFLAANQVSMAHAELYQGLRQDYLAAAVRGDEDHRLERGGHLLPVNQGLGIYAQTLDFGKLQRTTISNTTGAGLDRFGIRDWVFGVAYAFRPVDWLGIGAAGKYLREDIDRTKAQTMAADVGARAALQEAVGTPLFLAASLQNLGADPRFATVSEPLPVTFRMGAAWKPVTRFTLSADGVAVRNGSFSGRAGVEWWAAEHGALRVGWNGQNDAGPGVSIGVGFLIKNVLHVDYAFAPYGDVGDAHRMGVTVRW